MPSHSCILCGKQYRWIGMITIKQLKYAVCMLNSIAVSSTLSCIFICTQSKYSFHIVKPNWVMNIFDYPTVLIAI